MNDGYRTISRAQPTTQDRAWRELYYLQFLRDFLTRMKSLVTTKGQITIPKALRERFGIAPGTEVDFVATKEGIRLQKVVDRETDASVLGCLKEELSGRTTGAWLDELRGGAELPPKSKRNRRQ